MLELSMLQYISQENGPSGPNIHQDPPDSLELEILNRRNAFDLPPRTVCDALIDVFFKWISPVLPVVNYHEFMRKYNDPQDPPSILLLQAMLMVASRYYRDQTVEGYDLSPRTCYKKAKALYDAGYESDSTTVLQAVVLLGVFWDGPDELTESGIFYWSRLGIALAQECGLHERETYAIISPEKQTIWKRLWWTLYTRDRSVAAAFGRPLHINSEDCTVEPLTENDFIEYDEQFGFQHPPDNTAVQFFIQYVKLCQLMDLGLCLKLSSRSTQEGRRKVAAQCELGLNEWLVNCPFELQWRQSRHGFWSAILCSTFYTIVCQLHLLQAPSSSQESQSSAFHAASTIVSILETFQSRDELKYTPSFIMCNVVVSFVTLKCQMEATVPSLLHAIRLNLEANLDMLEALIPTWPIASMFLEFFRTMTGPEQFSRLLSVAIDQCRKRACGEEDEGTVPSRSTGHFKRPKVQQVILPQTKVVLQILQREAQRRLPSSSSPEDALRQESERFRSGANPDDNRSEPFNEVEPGPEDCDASTILQSLRQMIEIGKSASFYSQNGNIS